MAIFKGAAVAIVTPFFDNGEINYPKLAELLDYQIENGTDAIVICGTTGESSTLSHEEHLEAIRFTVEHVAKRVPVIAGTGSNCTETAIYLSQEAEKYGADALLVVTPYYNKATQKGLIAHYTAVAESVSLPVIMYNVPSRTGCNIQPETAVALAKNVKNIVGIKEASGNIDQVTEIKALCGDDLDVYSGEDGIITPILSVGGIGVISVLSHLCPRETHEICQKYFDGDVKGSAALQLKYHDLVKALFSDVNPIPVKAAMNLMGWNVGHCRMPLIDLAPETEEKLAQVMRSHGLI